MKRIVLTMLLIAALLQPFPAQAASPYDGPPSDLKAFEKTLLASLATISCTYKKGLGFFGTYALSQESKDRGQNSLIVTNQSLVNDCIRSSAGSISIGFGGRNYISASSGFNVDGTDLATVVSSLSPPKITLYDNFWPKLGGWVYVAYYVEGFGIIFRSSKVQLINETTYVLAIDGVTPTPVYGGIVFNSSGNFVGTVAMMGPGSAPAGMLKIHGAPLQCEIAGIERATITRCTEGTRTKIWTIDPPSGVVIQPTPRPSPTPTSSVIAREITAAQLTVAQAVQRFNSAVDSCDAEFEKLAEEVLEIVSDFEFLALCHSLDPDFGELESEIYNFNPRVSNVSQGLATLNRLATSVDGLTRELSRINSIVLGSGSTITTYARTISEIKGWLDLTAETWPELENRVSALPRATQTMIKKNLNYKKAMTLSDNLESKSEEISELVDTVSSVTSLGALRDAAKDAGKLKTSMKAYQEFSSTIRSIERLIPAFVCRKGQLVANLPKTGKCAPGYSKVSTR